MTKVKTNSVTIRDVARRAGVSIATVSRYINRTVHVSTDASERILEAMAEMEFIPHPAARRLATQRSNTLGIVLADMHGDFFGPLLSGIEDFANQEGYDLLVSSTSRPDSGREFQLGPHNTDGLLVYTNSLSEDRLARYYEMGFPMVLIHQTPPKDMNIPCVTVENKAASRKIVEHLIKVHGRRKIVFLRGPEKEEDSQWREFGYRAALEAHDIVYNPTLVASGEFERQVARSTIKELLRSGIEFDAVFSGDDESAIGVLAALQDSGKHVPEQVSVVGFDDQRMSAYLTPPLTTVRAPTEEVGRSAARCLIQLVQAGRVEPLTLLPTEIVLRQSCGCK